VNSHIIARFFTTPWEHDDRRLTYFDTLTRQFSERSSRSLLAESGKFSPEAEARLNRLVETPVSQYLSALLNLQPGDERSITSNWVLFRALALAVLLQGARVALGAEPELERVLCFPDAQIDDIIRLAAQRFDLFRLSCPQSQRLFYPATGIFAFPAPDVLDEWRFGFGLPLDGIAFLAFLEKSTDMPRLSELRDIGSGSYFTSFSVGADPWCRKILVHPDVLRDNTLAVIQQQIEEWRARTQKIFDSISEMYGLMDRLRLTPMRSPAIKR